MVLQIHDTRFLTHWGLVTQICVTKLTIIGSDNSLSPWRRRPIVWTNAGILLDPMNKLQWHFNRNSNTWLKKMHLKMSSEKCRPLCLGLNVWCRHFPISYTSSHQLPNQMNFKTHDEPFMFISKLKLASNVRKLITLFSNTCTTYSPTLAVAYHE